MLGLSDLVVEHLWNEAKGRHVEGYLPPQLPRLVEGYKVEVAPAVGYVELPGSVLLEEVELRLRPDVGFETLFFEPFKGPPEDPPRVCLVGLSVLVYVAVDPRYALPGNLGVGTWVGLEDKVALFNCFR
ncbi:hypothetical protein JCM16307_19570 [Thermococcus prieurii]